MRLRVRWPPGSVSVYCWRVPNRTKQLFKSPVSFRPSILLSIDELPMKKRVAELCLLCGSSSADIHSKTLYLSLKVSAIGFMAQSVSCRTSKEGCWKENLKNTHVIIKRQLVRNIYSLSKLKRLQLTRLGMRIENKSNIRVQDTIDVATLRPRK